MHNLVNKQNKVEYTIIYLRSGNKQYLHLLDTMLHRNNYDLKLSAHRKSSNNNELINLFSRHNNKIKPGISIEFYLMTLRYFTKMISGYF